MKLTTLFLAATITAFVGTGEVYADAIFLNDGRFISIDVDGHSGLPLPPAEYHFHEMSVPSSYFSDFNALIFDDPAKSSQNSRLSGLNFASSLAASGGYGGEFWSFQFQMKSVFDIVFELTSFYEFQTTAVSLTQMRGFCCPLTGSAGALYSLTGSSGDVFRYKESASFPVPFQASGLLSPGTYRLYGESIVQGSTYKFETFGGSTSLDFSMSLVPVPEGKFPLWPLAFPMSILLLWSPAKVFQKSRSTKACPTSMTTLSSINSPT